MKVIAHQHVGMDPNLINLIGCFDLVEKNRPIPVISENVLPFIAAAGHVIKSSGVDYSQWSRHVDFLCEARHECQE
jgi:hypothetical protein